MNHIKDWYLESKVLDKLTDIMVYSRFKIISKIGIKFWSIRFHI